MKKEKREINNKTELNIGNLRPGTVQFVVEEGIKAESLHEIINKVIELHGCTSCGLSGIDLNFRVRENILFERFDKIPGLHDIVIK